MKIKLINEDFTVSKVSDYSLINLESNFIFLSKTDEENSLVCPTALVPNNTIVREDGWKAFRIDNILDFSLIGILSKISSLLAQNNISIFAVSTYNTDYVLVKEECFQNTITLLKENNYEILTEE